MLIDFNKIQETTIQHLNNGDGFVSAKMFIDKNNKIMISRIPFNSSIGLHTHNTNNEINFVLSGIGKSICDGLEENLSYGTCQYCPKGSSHKIINTGQEDLVLFTFVFE